MTYFEWRKNCGLTLIDANILIKSASGYNQAQLICNLMQSIPTTVLLQLNQLQQRRNLGEPIAYILGNQEFYGRSFTVNSNVLIPRAESEHLIDFILQQFDAEEKIKLWDIGTGTGILAITLKLERPKWQIYASDISQQALNVAQHNSQTLAADIYWAQGSWFAVPLHFRRSKFDLIVANPPYIKQDDRHLTQGDLRFEPITALTDFNDGLTAYRILTHNAANYLKPDGYLCVEHGFEQARPIQALFYQRRYRQITTLLDYAGLDRITYGKTGLLSIPCYRI